uniref:Uncharacterized protein n=1 Tax=Ciona savignyi TaxID=51511 RepID=H2YER7_CIOSA
MALNRPRIDTAAVTKTSVVLGHHKEPKTTTYQEVFELGRSFKPGPKPRRFELSRVGGIFHVTETKYPQSVAQASFGKLLSKTTCNVYQHRLKELKTIMGIHSLNSVPIGPQPSNYRRENVTDTSQMKTDYMDRHHLLRQWVDIQTSNIPKLPVLKQKRDPWFCGQTEATHQFQWPKRDADPIYQVRFCRTCK